MIDAFPLDPIHMVFLGALRRLLTVYTSGPLRNRLSPNDIRAMSEDLMALKEFVPAEFARKPRPLDELRLFKATEFKGFGLYYAPIVFRRLSEAHYSNLLFLHAALFICHCSHLHHLLDYAGNLMRTFVARSAELLGHDFVSYNIHSLLHLPDECKKYGSLMEFSAFSFESFLGQVKSLVRSGYLPVQQVSHD